MVNHVKYLALIFLQKKLYNYFLPYNLLFQSMSPEGFMKLFKVRTLIKCGNDKQTGIAYHEAGHALIDLLYGFTPVLVTIIPGDGAAGHNITLWQANGLYDFDDYLFDLDLEWSKDEILKYHNISLMAGIIAQAFYTGHYDWEGANNDFNRIINVYMGYGIFDIPALQPFWDETFQIIEDNRDLLKNISLDLVKFETLKTEYFETLKKGVTKSMQPPSIN
jgi:hypothetical protein